MFIGFAIDDGIHGQFEGLYLLAGLGIAVLIFGALRRFVDSRMYEKAYVNLGNKMLAQLETEQASVRSARLQMLGEMVEFFENNLPALIQSIIGLTGTILILFALNVTVFVGSVILMLSVIFIYIISGGQTSRIHKLYNDESENQVNILQENDPKTVSVHLSQLMRWNTKLSDIETINFSISWLIMVVFLCGSIVIAISDGITQYGALFSLVMYVFQYIESALNVPIYYQGWLRLKEIHGRVFAG